MQDNTISSLLVQRGYDCPHHSFSLGSRFIIEFKIQWNDSTICCLLYTRLQVNAETPFPPEQFQEAAIAEAAVVDLVEDEAPVLVGESPERDSVSVRPIIVI